MKKFIYLCLLLALVGCTNSPTDYSDIFTKVEKESNQNMPELKTEKIILTPHSAEGILNSLSSRLKAGYTREYQGTYRTNYEVYVGDFVGIPLEVGEDAYNLVNYPKGVQYDTRIENGRLYFRSLYQGKYEIAIFSNGSRTRKIAIENKLNYEFTEQNNYEIISQYYSAGNLKGVNDAVAIHRIAFPNSFRDKELSFLLIELASKDGNAKIINDEINFLSNSTLLNEYDKKEILASLGGLTGVDYEIPSMFLNPEAQSNTLNNEVVKLLLVKNSLNENEIGFLEKVYPNISDNKELGKLIGNWYIQHGDTEKGKEYLDKSEGIIEGILGSFGLSGVVGEKEEKIELTPEEKTYAQFKKYIKAGKNSFANGNYVEALMYFDKAEKTNKDYEEQKELYFDRGLTYFNIEDYSKAVVELKKSLNLEKKDEKKAEIYYNIAMSYDKLGDKEQAMNYFTYIIQNYKDSTWSVKSSMHILEQ